MPQLLTSTLGGLANNALGTGVNTVGVSNTAPLVFNAANQAGQSAASAVENRYGTLGLGDSTMAATDISAARTQPFIQAAGQIAGLDLNAQEFNANAANTALQNYQNQLNALNSQLGALQGGQSGNTGGSGLNTGGNPIGPTGTPGGNSNSPGGGTDSNAPIVA